MSRELVDMLMGARYHFIISVFVDDLVIVAILFKFHKKNEDADL